MELIGTSACFGKPKVMLPLVLFVRVDSLHALVTGVSVIAPVVVEELFIQRRRRACLMSVAAVPEGSVAMLNFKKIRIAPLLLLNTLRSPLLP
jgi:hypothetical protein